MHCYSLCSLQLLTEESWFPSSSCKSKNKVPVNFKTVHAPNPTPSPSLPPPPPSKKISWYVHLFRWSNVPLNRASKSVKSPTHQWQCKSFPLHQTTVYSNVDTVKPLLSGHLQDLPKCPFIRGCSLNRGLWKLCNVCWQLLFNSYSVLW